MPQDTSQKYGGTNSLFDEAERLMNESQRQEQIPRPTPTLDEMLREVREEERQRKEQEKVKNDNMASIFAILFCVAAVIFITYVIVKGQKTQSQGATEEPQKTDTTSDATLCVKEDIPQAPAPTKPEWWKRVPFPKLFLAWAILGIIACFFLPQDAPRWLKFVLAFPFHFFIGSIILFSFPGIIIALLYSKLTELFPRILVDIAFLGTAFYVFINNLQDDFLTLTISVGIIWFIYIRFIDNDSTQQENEESKSKQGLQQKSQSAPPNVRATIERFVKEYKSTPKVEKPSTAVKSPSTAIKAPSAADLARAELELFWARNKTDAEIGKLYELYIGQLYEKNGYDVEYFGIEHGLRDLGRDLICRMDGHTLLVQCKNWSKSKTIHVKYIHQFFGTLAQYMLQHPDEQVQGAFITTTYFSSEASKAAESLKIQLQYCAYPRRFPIVKCKQDDNGKRVYYLPTDYQYDMVKLDLNKGDCYCRTVDEAESAGFQWIKFSTQ